MIPVLLGELPAPLIISGAFVLGLLVGSFLNVVVLRLPPRLKWEWTSQCRELLEQGELDIDAPPDLVRVPSHCPKCSHPIRWYENIPVLSWLALRGRCSNCETPISVQYPAVELATGVFSAVVVWALGPTLLGLGALLLTWTLIALSVIDFREQLLPDNLTLPLLWIGLLVNASGYGFTDATSAVWGAAAGYLLLWSIFHGFRLLTGKEGMGYGDFKLLGALGAWLGWQMLPLIILLASFVGAALGIAIIVIRGKDRNLPMPFGPYLAGAGFIALLFGESMISTYLQASGLQ